MEAVCRGRRLIRLSLRRVRSPGTFRRSRLSQDQQVAFADPAIRAAEAGDRAPEAIRHLKLGDKIALARIRHGHGCQFDGLERQSIDVPMRFLVMSEMSPDAGSQSTAPPCTAGVDIPSSCKVRGPHPAQVNGDRFAKPQYE